MIMIKDGRLILDHSQYYTWMSCPWRWYEKYINKIERVPTRVLRDDALCIGSLVHNGLENFYRSGRLNISPEAIEENTPTPATLYMCNIMIQQYAQQYAGEPSNQLELVEAPVIAKVDDDYSILAKVDSYFYVPETVPVSVGFLGQTTMLTPGWWIREHKTKSPYISMESFMQRWLSDMQANFQCLTLQATLNEPVQGVLINVLEKPIIRAPKRKCKGCGSLQEFTTYIEVGENLYACPLCSYKQQLKQVEAKSEAPRCNFYRLPVFRTQGQLEQAAAEIDNVAQSMLHLVKEGMLANAPRRPECAGQRWGPCEFQVIHVTNQGTPIDGKLHPKYQEADTTKYMGLSED